MDELVKSCLLRTIVEFVRCVSKNATCCYKVTKHSEKCHMTGLVLYIGPSSEASPSLLRRTIFDQHSTHFPCVLCVTATSKVQEPYA